MSNVFTLDSYREEVDKEFAPVKVALRDGTEVTLKNILRLNKATRKKVLAALKVLNQEDKTEDGVKLIEDLAAASEELVSLVAGSDAKKLLDELDGDVHVTLKVINQWMDQSQAGEASNSPN